MPKCPECGSENAAKIVYGLPPQGSMKKFDEEEGKRNRKFTLGGCCVEDEKWSCNDCEFEW